MASASEYAGIAQGAAQFGQWLDQKPERDARRKEAEFRAQQSQIKLEEYKANAPVRQAQRDQELAKLQSETYQINANLAKQQSYDSFTKFQADGDSRHLNNWLTQAKGNPVAANITQGMTRLDTLDRNKETEKLLRENGVTDLDGFFSDPSLVNTYTIGTTADGSKSLVDMNRMYAVTGYTQYATDRELANIRGTAATMGQLRQGGNLANINEQSAIVGQVSTATGLPREDVYKMLREEPDANRAGSSSVERIAANLRAGDVNLSYQDSLKQAVELTSRASEPSQTNEAKFIEDYQNRHPGATYEEGVAAYRQAGRDTRTATVKNLEYAQEARGNLDKMFGGDFLDADLSNLTTKQTAEMANYVNQLEKAGDVKLSNEDKKIGRNITRLLSLGGSVAEGLTPEQTGLLDSTFNYMKKYISDNVEGKEATVAYENFRAIGRNALFGSQVSASDYTAFNKAFASLGQQTGPVLESLRGQMSLIREDLNSMVALNDPYVTKARFGLSIEEADRVIDAIDARLDIISRLAAGKPVDSINTPAPATEVKVTTTEQGSDAPARPPLEDFFQ